MRNEIDEGGSTVATTLKLEGTASRGQQVEIFDGSGPSAESKGVAPADPATGYWTRTFDVPVGGRRLYAKSLYHPDTVYSNVRHLTVTAEVTPTISSVKDSKGVEILEGKDTADNNVTLTGTASRGLKVQVFDGVTLKGEATADLETGTWTREVPELTEGSHSFTTKALYGSGQISEPPRTFRIVQLISMYENFESTQPQQILVNKPITFPSGLMFTLSSEGGVNGFYTRIAQDIHPEFGRRTLTFTQRSVGTFSWSGAATTIKFAHYGVNSTGNTVTFRDQSNNPIIEERLQTGSGIKFHIYSAPQGRFVSSFVIKSTESDGGFFIDDVTLSN